MSDLISRQTVLAAIDKNRDALLSIGMTSAEHVLVHYGRRVIEEQPTIDPVKHGEWIEVQTGKWHGWKCSECGKIVQKKRNSNGALTAAQKWKGAKNERET